MGLNIYFFNILVVWCIQQVCAKFGSLSCLSSDVLLVYICILHLKLSRFLSFPCLGLSASRPPLSPHPTLNSMVFFEQLYKISSLENKNSFTGFTMTVAPTEDPYWFLLHSIPIIFSSDGGGVYSLATSKIISNLVSIGSPLKILNLALIIFSCKMTSLLYSNCRGGIHKISYELLYAHCLVQGCLIVKAMLTFIC
jgi:hypothetical protein